MNDTALSQARPRRTRGLRRACLGALALAFAATATAQDATLIRLTDTSLWATPSPDPSAITFLPATDRLLIADAEVNEIPTLFTGDNVFLAAQTGDMDGSLSSIGITDEPSGMTHDPASGHLFIATDNSPRRVYEIDPGDDGQPFTADDIVTSFSTVDFGSADAEGLSWNPARGALHLVDGLGDRLYTIEPGSNGLFDGVPPIGDDIVDSVDLASLGVTDPEGVTFDPLTEQLYIIGKPRKSVLHLTADGQPLRTVTLDSPALFKPAGLVIAPSSLDNGADSLFIVDRGVDNDSDPTENDGRLFEFTLPPLPDNAPPSVEIAAPLDDSVFTAGDTIGFAASAVDTEEGDLSAAIDWTSDIDGPLGSGAAISIASLSVGLHQINASVTDGDDAQGVDSVSLRIASAGTTIVETRVTSGADDAEQRGQGAKVWLGSEDIELTRDGSVHQTVGLRFDALTLPRGAHIDFAYIQFQADRPEAGAMTLSVRAEASDDAAPITRGRDDLGKRPTTDATVAWQPPDWKLTGDSGPAQRTADLAPLVQELIDRPGWDSGQAMLFIVEGPGTGNARRAAIAFETDPDAAPLLHVRYGVTPTPPLVAISTPAPGARFGAGDPISLAASAEDAPDGNLSDLIDWESDRDGPLGSGPLLNIATLSTGPHRISARVTDSDGQLAVDTVDIVVEAVQNTPPSVIIAAPAGGAVFTTDSAITLVASANDAEDGDLSAALDWASDLDGALGDGEPTVSLSAGTHLLTAIVTDTEGAVGSDSVSVQVTPVGGGTTTVRYRIATGADDAEERDFRGVSLNSGDLELTFDGSRQQVVGLRFTDVAIPQGAGILSASVQFQADERSSDLAFLEIHGVDSGDALPFVRARRNLSSRARTPVSVGWMPPPWNSVGAAGAEQRTPDLAPILQHVVTRGDWTPGNALALLVSGDGIRVAEAFEGSSAAAAELVVTYTLDNAAPDVNAGADRQIVLGQTLSLQGTASDDGQPESPGALSIRWSLADGPVPTDFADATSLSTTVDFQSIGSYRIRLAADDGELTGVDELVVTVEPSAGNTAPAVSTGPDLTAGVGETVSLSGSVDDDGLVAPPVITWSQVAGPDEVAFADPGSASTTAVFPSVGVYTLELAAFDGELVGTGTLLVSIVDANGQGRVEIAVASENDDAEELVTTGRIRLASSDLELVFDDVDQLIGIRFAGVAVPNSATIESARVQFTAEDAGADATDLLVHGEASDDAAPFTSTRYSISSRALTGAAVAWTPPPWTASGANGSDQLTPDLSVVVQEIVDRSDWSNGNALVFVFSGNGLRVAEAFEGEPDAAARLVVEFRTAP